MTFRILTFVFFTLTANSLDAIERFHSIGCDRIDVNVGDPFYKVIDSTLHIIIPYRAVQYQSIDVNVTLRRSIRLGLKKFVMGEYKYSNFSLETSAALQRKNLTCESSTIFVFSIPTQYLIVKKLSSASYDRFSFNNPQIFHDANEFDEYQ